MDTSSAGHSTTNPASEQARLMSSILICDGPSSPIEIPLCVPTTFRFTRGNAAVTRNCSNPLFSTNTEKLDANGIFPEDASAAPIFNSYFARPGVIGAPGALAPLLLWWAPRREISDYFP